MRMAVDEAGRQPSPPQFRVSRATLSRGTSRAQPTHAITSRARTHGAVAHHAIGNAAHAHRCEVRVDQQQVEWRWTSSRRVHARQRGA